VLVLGLAGSGKSSHDGMEHVATTEDIDAMGKDVATPTSSSSSSSTDDTTSSSSFPLAAQVCLFLGAVLLWGGGDSIAAYIGRGKNASTLLQVALGGSVGQLFTAAIYGFCAVATGEKHDSNPPLPDGGSSSDMSHAAGLALLAGGNVAGVLGWLAFVSVGATGVDASAFAPLTSLYVYVPVLLGVAVLGESVTLAKAAGLVMAVAASVLLAGSWGGKGGERAAVAGGKDGDGGAFSTTGSQKEEGESINGGVISVVEIKQKTGEETGVGV
jgi:drug/metabolite transporter (DMT)-like permease